MIRRETPEGWLMLTQTSHAWVSGQLARAWGNEQFARPAEEVILATSLHDIGWLDWDAAPPLHPDGRPISFTEVSFEDTVGHWERAVMRLRQFNPYAALMVSKHASTVFRVRMERGVDPQDKSQPRLTKQASIQQQLIDHIQGLYGAELDPLQIEANYRILRTCDLLSLAICVGKLAPGQIEDVPSESAATRVTLNYHPLDDTTLALNPYPFSRSEVVVRVEARSLTQRTFASQSDYHAALETAKWVILNFRFVPAPGA